MKIRIHFTAFLSLGLGLLLVPGCSKQAPLATITVQPAALGAQIPRDFVGFSLEVSTGGQGLHAFRQSQAGSSSGKPAEEIQYALGRPGAPNTGFFQFMRNLGPGILRLGGNSQDNTCWDPKRAPHPEWCQAALTPSDMQLFAEAARSTGWRLILGLNLKQNSPTWALGEITEGIAPDIKPEQLLGLEIGNEPDLFRRGARPATYSPADHVKEFLGYVQAFRKNGLASAYAIAGPATCCQWRNPSDLGTFMDGVGPQNLGLVTVHNYPETTCNGTVVTAAQLLAPALMTHFDNTARALVAAAGKRHLPIALAETNSASCGGMPGVSNAFAAAIWGLDYMFSAARDGFRAINFHMSYRPGGGSSYNAIDTSGRENESHAWAYRNVAEPLYYAMYLFARHAAGDHLLPASISTAANIHAFAVSSCAGCTVQVFVINEDLKGGGRVEVRAPGRRGGASLLLLQAPGLSSTASAVHLGGVQFDSDGHLPAPKTVSLSSGSHGDYTFDLPDASAAVLTIRESQP